MNQSLEFRVYGTPAPQGSKRHVGNGVMVESSKKVKPWRQDVVQAALDAIAMHDGFQTFTGPVSVKLVFYFPRPKYHFGTGKNSGVLKPSAPAFVSARPDIEKLVRSTHDALTTAAAWQDDALCVSIRATKVYDSLPGAFVSMKEAVL